MIDRKILLGYGAFLITGIAAGIWLGNRKTKGEAAATPAPDSKLALKENIGTGKPLTIDEAMEQAAGTPPQMQQRQQGRRNANGNRGGNGGNGGGNGGGRSVVKNSRYSYDISTQSDFDDWKGK